nr:hypothetical protein [Sinorhizobium meliloti]
MPDTDESLFNVHYPIINQHGQASGDLRKRDRDKSVGGTDCRHVGLEIARQALDDCGSQVVFAGETVSL